MSSTEGEDITKERLLDKAEELFAQKGYHAVSVREITRATCCNLAAVNYHFGNKQNLYLEVFRARWVPRAGRVVDSFRNSLSARRSSLPSAVIQALAQAFLEGPLSDEERLRHSQLITREMVCLTEAFYEVAEQVMRQFVKELAAKLGSALPEEHEEERLTLNILCILGIVLYFNFARVAVSSVIGRRYDPAFKAQLVEHITEFSLRGLGEGETKEKRNNTQPGRSIRQK